MAKITSFVAAIAFISTIASVSVFVNIRSSEDAIPNQQEERIRTIRTKVGLSSYAPKDASFPNPRRLEETTGSTKDDKICVVHVGPHKTGTTTLQDFFKKAVAQDALKRDNYKEPSFPGIVRKNDSQLVHCFRPNLNKHCRTETFRSDMKKNFASFVSDATMNDSNILLTSEEFAEPDLNIIELMGYLVPDYKIHVVVYYRRFYDWIYSLYNQLIKMGRLYNGEPITFVEWLDLETIFERYENGLSSAAVYDRYKKAPEVFNMTVVNMHEDPDNFNTLTRFTCDHMDDAPELCKVAKSYKGDGNHNLSIDLNWKIFRVNIRHHHSIQLSDDDERWEQIEEKFYQMTDIPQVCLSTEWKDKLLQTSLEAEIALTPEWWYNSEEGLENLKSDFEEKINSKFCSMNVNAILTSSEWQNFLTELEEDAVEEGS